MKSLFLALALISTLAHATEDTGPNPCDEVENDVQTPVSYTHLTLPTIYSV